MRFFSRSKPKIKVQKAQKDGFSGWLKCSGCHELIHANELEKKYNCCPKCNYHYRLSTKERIENLTDQGSFSELFSNLESTNPLDFTDTVSYTDRLAKAKKKSNQNEAVVVGTCTIEENKVALGVMNFSFMGGSMGSVVGEKLTRLIEYALENKLPVIIVCASGGARMQESIFSLMQMTKTAAALAKLHEAKLPYISILTNPTTGGVTASFASLGDVIIAEPKALIGFAGRRVIEQTIGDQLPEGAQESEFLLKHGMIDCIVNRQEMKAKVAECVNMLTSTPSQLSKEEEIGEETLKDERKISIVNYFAAQ